jgi:hypothetical protein
MTDSPKEKKEVQLQNKLAVFEDKHIRRSFHKGEWYFSIIDIVRVLTGSSDPSRYWPELKKQLIDNEGFVQLLGKIEQLKLESNDGEKYKTDTANTETIFRIIQSMEEKETDPLEQEANCFAANLLVPAYMIDGLLSSLIPNKTIATLFQVSEAVITFRRKLLNTTV